MAPQDRRREQHATESIGPSCPTSRMDATRRKPTFRMVTTTRQAVEPPVLSGLHKRMLETVAMARSLQVRLEEAVRRELGGELVRWSGRPSAWRAFVQVSLVLPMGIAGTAVSSISLAVLLDHKLPNVVGPPLNWSGAIVVGEFALFLWVFVLISVFQMLFPFLQAWYARNTVYALTDKRLITLREGWKTHVETVRPGHIHDIKCKERRDGSGDLRLTINPAEEWDLRLVGVPEVRKLEGMLTRFKVRGGKPP